MFRSIFVLVFSILGYTLGCFSQAITVNKDQLTEQILTDLQNKLSSAIYDKFKSVNNQVELNILKQWNFTYLLEDYKDLGIDPNDPQLTTRLGESLSQLYQTYAQSDGSLTPFTVEDVKAKLTQYWKPTAELVLDKKSADILDNLHTLVQEGQTKIQNLLEATERIHELPEAVPEAEIVNLLRSKGLDGDILTQIEPLEQVFRYGQQRFKDPLEAAQIIRTAMGSKEPVAKIQALLTLGEKFGNKVPVIGELLTPLFQLGNAVLDATLQLGKGLSQKLNQGCISNVGQYNAQQDPRAQSFLKAFPSVDRACPVLDSRMANKSAPLIYTQTFYNEENETDLFFYHKNAWIKGRNSPRHQGIRDIKGLITFVRNRGKAQQVYDQSFMINAYNSSPGFISLQHEVLERSRKLGEAYRRIYSQLSLCEDQELRDFFEKELEFSRVFNLFLGSIKPEWADLSTSYFWESVLPEELLYLHYLGKLDYPNLQFAQTSGYAKIEWLQKLQENLDFRVIEIYGQVRQGGRPLPGVDLNFEKAIHIYNRYDDCTRLRTDSYGNFRFFYLKYPPEIESLYLEATAPDGKSERKDLRLASQAVYEVNFSLEATPQNPRPEEVSGGGAPECGTGYYWDASREECVAYCSTIAHASASLDSDGNFLGCECESGYSWNADRTTCLINIQEVLEEAPCAKDPHGKAHWDTNSQAVVCECENGFTWDETQGRCLSDQEQACNEAFTKCQQIAHTTFEYDAQGCTCLCGEGFEWNEDRTACIPKQETPTIDCEALNAVAVSDPQTGETRCECKSGFEPHVDGSTCVPIAPDCGIAHATARWNPQDEVYECDCETGYAWNTDYTECIPAAPDCSIWGPAEAQWNSQDQTWECVCEAGYQWDATLERCVPTPPDCDQYPNAILLYDKFQKEYYCECPTGYKWNRKKTACIKIDPQRNREVAQGLVDVLTAIGGGLEGGTSTRDNPVVRPEQRKRGECNITYRNGANEPEEYTIDVGFAQGMTEFSYQTFTVEDRIHLYQGGSKIYDSGCVGTGGWRTQQIRLNGIFSEVRIVVDPLCDPNDPDNPLGV